MTSLAIRGPQVGALTLDAHPHWGEASIREVWPPCGSLTEDAVMVPTVVIENGPAWLRDLAANINDVARLPHNWDSYGARRLNEKAAWHGLALLAGLQFGGPAPRASVSPDGDLQMTWRADNVELEIEVTRDGDVDVYLESDTEEQEWRSSVFGDERLLAALARVGTIDD